MALTTNRHEVRQALTSVLSAVYGIATPPVAVSYGFPGTDDVEREHIYTGDARGTMEIADLKAGRKRRIDEFSIDVWFVAGQDGQTAVEACARCQTFLATLDSALADDMQPGNVDGLRSARIGDFDGPDPVLTDQGWAAIARVEVLCESRFV